MPPRKRRRACTPRGAAAATSQTWRLPADILLEVTARTDTVTFIRCAATCKALRREILHPDFVRRVCSEPDGIVPTTPMLGFLDRTFSLVHPATPATVSLAHDHLAPFVSRSAAGLLEQYRPVTSRGALVLLERRSLDWRRRSDRRPDDMCVYDPMTNSRTFIPFPRWHEYRARRDHLYRYVLLTPADGGVVGCSSFTLLAADIITCNMQTCPPLRLQTVSSDDGGEWGPVSYATNPSPSWSMPVDQDNAAVVVNGVVHWLMLFSNYILTYNIGTGKAGLIELPVDRLPANWRVFESCLRLSPDGKLCLATVHGLRVSIWLLSEVDDGWTWTRHAEVDMEPILSSLFSSCKGAGGHCFDLQLQSSGGQRSGVVLLRVQAPDNGEELVVLDMETMETSWIGEISGLPFEVNLVSRLSGMQTFKFNN